MEKIANNCENNYTDMAEDGAPLLSSQDGIKFFGYTAAQAETSPRVFPGLRRPIAFPTGPPKDHVLIRTAGNALQAIPRRYLEQTVTKKSVLGVPVPANSCGGDSDNCLVVKNPKDRKLVQVTVPKNYAPGQMLFVEMPVEEAPAAGVTAEKPSHDLELGTSPGDSKSSHCHALGFVVVHIPEGQTPGSRLQVSLADGRSLMVVVPSDPSIREFYIKVPDV